MEVNHLLLPTHLTHRHRMHPTAYPSSIYPLTHSYTALPTDPAILLTIFLTIQASLSIIHLSIYLSSIYLPTYLLTFLPFNPHPRTCFVFREREGQRERNIDLLLLLRALTGD